MVLLLLLHSKDARCHASIVELCNVAGKTGTPRQRRPRKLELDYGLYLHLQCTAEHRRRCGCDDWRQETA